MKFIFLLLICFLNLNSAELLLKESHKINKDLKVNIYINNDEYKELGFKILDRNENTIYEDNEFISYIEFKKLSENYIFITKDTGGTCCANYVILEIKDEKIKNIKKFDFGNCRIDSIFVNKKNELEFTTCDSQSIDEISPQLIFKNFKLSINDMRQKTPSSKVLEKFLNKIKNQKMLEEYLLNLIYGGNIDSSLKLFYMYDKKFPEEENISFLSDFFSYFYNSNYFEDILKVNKISLTQFEELMIKNNIIIRKED